MGDARPVEWARVKLLVLDGDGVLSEGVWYSGNFFSTRFHRFSRRDGMGIALVKAEGIKIALLTGTRDAALKERANELKFDETLMGCTDKRSAVSRLCSKLDIHPSEVAYIGDDVNDLGALEMVGIPVAVADAVPHVIRAAKYITMTKGGAGAVREVCDLILMARRCG